MYPEEEEYDYEEWSELAKDLQELCGSIKAELSPEDAKKLIKFCVATVIKEQGDKIRQLLTGHLQSALVDELRQYTKAHIDTLWSEMLMREVNMGTSWEEKRIAIADIIRLKLEEELKAIKAKQGDPTNAFKKFLNKEIASLVEEATQEFAREVKKEFSKQAMANIVKGVAVELAQDKKLLALLQHE